MPFSLKEILKGLTPYGLVRLREKRRAEEAAPAPIGPGGVRIICYEDLDAWILGKFATRLRDELYRMHWRADIAKQGDSSAAVGHHIIFYNTQKKWAPVETLMITHVTTAWMLEKVRSLLQTFDMGICMSRETVSKLVWEGLPRERLCYVSPAHDGIIKPRPIALGLFSRVYADKRKNEDDIPHIFDGIEPGLFSLTVMGAGWESLLAPLREQGHLIEYYPRFDYDAYVRLMPQMDYFLYLGFDEGAMSFLDAVCADVKTIVTPQGYHLDLPEGITHPVNNLHDVNAVLRRIAAERARRPRNIAHWTWREHAWRHMVIWKYLLELRDPALPAHLAEFAAAARQRGKEPAAALRALEREPLQSEALLQAHKAAKDWGLRRAARHYARKALIYHPELENCRHYLQGCNRLDGPDQGGCPQAIPAA